MAVKKKEGENLDHASIKKAIAHLENKGTKKEAYEILNIKANPQRLQKIIDEYNNDIRIDKEQRAKKRGKPLSDFEIREIIQRTLDGDPLSEIANSLYRSVAVVKNALEPIGVPKKRTGNWYDNRFETTIPDEAVRDSYSLGELVWSDKYNGPCIILKARPKDVYQIYVIEKIEEQSPYFAIEGYGGKYADVHVSDLGSLEHLQAYGVDVYKPYRPYFSSWLKNESA